MANVITFGEIMLRLSPDSGTRLFQNDRLTATFGGAVKLVKEGACERMSASRIHMVGKLLGGAEGEICAKALAKGETPEWRQAGWALLGDCLERRAAYTEAIDAYRKSDMMECYARHSEVLEQSFAFPFRSPDKVQPYNPEAQGQEIRYNGKKVEVKL